MTSPRRIKDGIENATGLSLGDALNVAMFLLTVSSLLAAVISLAIAKWTYEDAKEGGREQLEAMRAQQGVLKDSATALKDEAANLVAANQVLHNLLEQSKDQLAASKAQLVSSRRLVDEMNQGVQTSTKQLELAKQELEHRQELESRHPVLQGEILCWHDFPDSVYSVSLPLRGPGDAPPSANPVLRVLRGLGNTEDNLRLYACEVHLTNKGSAPVEDGFMHFSWAFALPGGNPDSSGGIRARIPDDTDLDGSNAPWHQSGLVLFDKAKLYTTEFYGRSNYYRFQLGVPDKVKQFELSYHIVGSNFPRAEGTIVVRLARPGEP